MVKRLVIAAVILTLAGMGGWYYLLYDSMAAIVSDDNSNNVSTLVEGGTTNPNEHTFPDVDFAKKMIVHNQQGMLMGDLVEINSSNSPELLKLVRGIRLDQEDSTRQYISWMNEWNEEYLNLSDFPEMDGHDMYPTYPDMATASELAQLRKISGTEFDELFVRLTIKHHEGAITMAKGGLGQSLNFGGMIRLRDSVVQKYSQDLETLRKLQNGEEE